MGSERGLFDGRGHLIGCGEWAKLWERYWGRANVDVTTQKNLDAMKLRGRCECCRPVTTCECPDGAHVRGHFSGCPLAALHPDGQDVGKVGP